MKTKILILTFPLLLISCIEVRDPNKKSEQVETVEQPQPVAEVTPLDLPQQYAVSIKNVTAMSQVTRKPTDLIKQMEVATVSVVDVEAEDIVDQPGHYSYVVQQNGRTYEVPVEIPQDFVIEGNMTLNQLETNLLRDDDHYRTLETDGRIFFKAGATLTTNGENLLLKASSIDSEGALVQTMPAGLKALPAVAGRHGGDIKLEAQSLRGTLQFFMRGESGGDGEGNGFFARKTWDQLDNNGKNGGNSGFLEVAVEDLSKGRITYSLEPGHGGVGVPVIIACLDKRICRDISKKPKGSDGFDGIAQQPMGLK